MSTRFEQQVKELNRNQTLPLSYKRTLKSIMKSTDAALSIAESFVTANLKGNQLISGGASWVSGLTFHVSDCVFVVDGALYTSEAADVTLTAADATHPRIDVIAVNIDGTTDVVTGTAAATPAKPEADPDAQVEVTFANILATATEPSGVSSNVIYDEDDDWTAAVSSATRVVKADTSDPFAGTKAIKLDGAIDGDYITLTTGTAVSPTAIDVLQLQIKPINISTSRKSRLRLAWYNGTTRVSDFVDLRNGLYGFDATYEAYHTITIPMSQFQPNGSGITVLRIEFSGTGGATASALIDNIKYQSGITSSSNDNFARLDATNSFSKAQASGITVLTDGATVTCDLSQGNVFSLTLGGNRIIDFTNPVPGQHFTLFLTQDGTGSRTVTWDSANDWAGGTAPTLTTTAAAVDVLTFAVDAAGNIHGSLGIADSK